MKSRLTFRGLIFFLFIGTLIPLLVVVGLLVYRLQQAYLLDVAQRYLINFVQAGVEQFSADSDLTLLAVSLSESFRVIGADLFVLNAAGNPVPPSLGTGPWLEIADHQAVQASRQSIMQMIGAGDSARLVYLTTIVDQNRDVLGTVEASLPMANINDQLNALRRWLLLIITLASGLSILLAVVLSGIITRPISSLVASVDLVRQGNLETRAPVSEVRELGQLAITYNQMLDRISLELQQRARLAENMRRFAANASHELRSPLSVFRSSVELLDKAFHQDDHRRLPEILAILRKEVDTMTGLVENLLLLARLDQSGESVDAILHPEVIDPVPLLEEVYERSRLLARGQEVELEWPKGEIGPIWADRDMLRRALNNLVENAVTYTPAGKKITLRLENRNGSIAFVIEDQGIGIPPDQLPKIFERFYRGDESRSRRVSGSGLGLAIVEAVVRAHDGEIQVESVPEQGTCFRLSFKQMDAPGQT